MSPGPNDVGMAMLTDERDMWRRRALLAEERPGVSKSEDPPGGVVLAVIVLTVDRDGQLLFRVTNSTDHAMHLEGKDWGPGSPVDARLRIPRKAIDECLKVAEGARS